MFETVLRQLEPFSSEFSRHGKQIFLVGGAVRNLLLGRPVQDFDFTTDALPDEVQRYFRRVLPTGLQHGTVTVLFQGQNYEVTTFRVDGGYSDGRRPDEVVFTPSLEDDLKRRDFTINAVALNLVDGTIFDPHDGQGDLSRRLLRAIGEPGKRFDEDALRLLRLFRFASQLDFSIDPETLTAVPPRRPKLSAVSKERIREELAKSLAGAKPRNAWGPLYELGFLADLFPTLSPEALTEAALDQLASLDLSLRWSFWLTLTCGQEHEQWEQALRMLTFSNADVAAALGPAKVWTVPGPLKQRAKAVIEAWGSRDRVALGVEYLNALKHVGYWNDEGQLAAEIVRASDSGEPIFLSELALGGKDILNEGIAAGPEVGKVLKRLQHEVWSAPDLNSPGALRTRLKSFR